MHSHVVIRVKTIKELEAEKIFVKHPHPIQFVKDNMFRLCLNNDDIPRNCNGEFIFSRYCHVNTAGFVERIGGLTFQESRALPILPADLIELFGFTSYVTKCNCVWKYA